MSRLGSVFVDSDVVISSLISQSGAAYLLLNKLDVNFFISNVSLEELKTVVKRLKLDMVKLSKLVKERLEIVKLDSKGIEKKYKDHVIDVNDAHIIAGAVEADARFLISYNVRYFKTDKIKTDFDIVVLTPARFLQYMRSN